MPTSKLFGTCIESLVEDLFIACNDTMLAYGRTGFGKMYTMDSTGGINNGVIFQVIESIFNQVETLKGGANIKIKVSFIEMHRCQIFYLLDSIDPPTSEGGFQGGSRTLVVLEEKKKFY
jgi:hypothetical protein